MNWEYVTLTQGTNEMDGLDVRLNALGSLGWEAVGYASMDRTVGVNAVSVLLRREAMTFPHPHTLKGSAAWLADPARRYSMRYWDGLRWTQHVAGGNGERDVDYPNVRE